MMMAGISAGSMAAGRSLALATEVVAGERQFIDPDYYDHVMTGEASNATLGLVDLVLRPHLNSPDFPEVRANNIAQRAKGLPWPVYALDDQSALRIVDGRVEVASEGEWAAFNVERPE